MKKEKTKLEVIGGELINIAKCIKYFKNKFGWGLIMPVRSYDCVQYPSVVLEE